MMPIIIEVFHPRWKSGLRAKSRWEYALSLDSEVNYLLDKTPNLKLRNKFIRANDVHIVVTHVRDLVKYLIFLKSTKPQTLEESIEFLKNIPLSIPGDCDNHLTFEYIAFLNTVMLLYKNMHVNEKNNRFIELPEKPIYIDSRTIQSLALDLFNNLENETSITISHISNLIESFINKTLLFKINQEILRFLNPISNLSLDGWIHPNFPCINVTVKCFHLFAFKQLFNNQHENNLCPLVDNERTNILNQLYSELVAIEKNKSYDIRQLTILLKKSINTGSSVYKIKHTSDLEDLYQRFPNIKNYIDSKPEPCHIWLEGALLISKLKDGELGNLLAKLHETSYEDVPWKTLEILFDGKIKIETVKRYYHKTRQKNKSTNTKENENIKSVKKISRE